MAGLENTNESTDMFDDIVLAEDRFQREGYEEGVQVGRRRGYDDGERMGLEHGAKIGSELGFYVGFISTWQQILFKDGPLKQRKVQVLETLCAMIQDFPLIHPENTAMQDQLWAIRAKFKQACSLFNIKPDYSGRESITGVTF